MKAKQRFYSWGQRYAYLHRDNLAMAREPWNPNLPDWANYAYAAGYWGLTMP